MAEIVLYHHAQGLTKGVEAFADELNKKAKEIGFVNFSYPKAKLKEETVKLAKKLMEKSPAVLSYTKEGIPLARHERGWDVEDIEEVDRLAEEEEEED